MSSVQCKCSLVQHGEDRPTFSSTQNRMQKKTTTLSKTRTGRKLPCCVQVHLVSPASNQNDGFHVTFPGTWMHLVYIPMFLSSKLLREKQTYEREQKLFFCKGLTRKCTSNGNITTSLEDSCFFVKRSYNVRGPWLGLDCTTPPPSSQQAFTELASEPTARNRQFTHLEVNTGYLQEFSLICLLWMPQISHNHGPLGREPGQDRKSFSCECSGLRVATSTEYF